MDEEFIAYKKKVVDTIIICSYIIAIILVLIRNGNA
jgi:hypothetical protein